mgnify:CR=1 FL=1
MNHKTPDRPAAPPSYETRPPLPDLLAMGLDDVEAWWPFMLARERIAWFDRETRCLDRKAHRRLSKIPEDDDNPLSPEDEAGLDAASDPKVKRWLRRLNKVLGDMPPGVFISTSYDSASVHAKVGDVCDHGPETELGVLLPGTWRAAM